MLYKKINVELIVLAEEADAVVSPERGTRRNGKEIRSFRWWHRESPVEHSGARRKSAFIHQLLPVRRSQAR